MVTIQTGDVEDEGMQERGYVVEAPQQQQGEHDMPSHDSSATERGKRKKRSNFESAHETDEWSQRETTANLPVVRGNTPRFANYSSTSETAHNVTARIETGTTTAGGEQHELEEHPPFPSKPPSAPPVPEAVTTFDVIEKSRLPEAIHPLPEELNIVQRVDVQSDSLATRNEQAQSQPSSTLVSSDVLTSLPQKVSEASASYRRLVGFAIYLLCLLLLVLGLAIVQGTGVSGGLLMSSIVLLGVPWMVLVYGLLGGCVSCLVTLGRMQPENPPVFVVITWYARPFVSVILALCAYLLLNSGLLLSAGGGERHQALALLVAIAAGIGEGWLFLRRRT